MCAYNYRSSHLMAIPNIITQGGIKRQDNRATVLSFVSMDFNENYQIMTRSDSGRYMG